MSDSNPGSISHDWPSRLYDPRSKIAASYIRKLGSQQGHLHDVIRTPPIPEGKMIVTIVHTHFDMDHDTYITCFAANFVTSSLWPLPRGKLLRHQQLGAIHADSADF